MLLIRTDSGRIAALADQPRRVHHAGVWFADETGIVTHRVDYDLWVQMGEPDRLDFDMPGVDLAAAEQEARSAAETDAGPPRLRSVAPPPIRPANRSHR